MDGASQPVCDVLSEGFFTSFFEEDHPKRVVTKDFELPGFRSIDSNQTPLDRVHHDSIPIDTMVIVGKCFFALPHGRLRACLTLMESESLLQRFFCAIHVDRRHGKEET